MHLEWAKWTSIVILLFALWLMATPVTTEQQHPDSAQVAKGSMEATDNTDYSIATKNSLEIFTQTFYRFHGAVEGRIVALETVETSVKPWGEAARVKAVFNGTVGNSEPGAFTAVIYGIYNPALSYPAPFRATFKIIPGSGQAGLRGICGSGEIFGQEPAPGYGDPTAEYQFKINFAKVCEAN